LVPASINVDPINPVVSQEADDENQQVSNTTTLETCECYKCGEEIGEKEGFISDETRICNRCAYEWRVMEKPSAHYFDENNETFDKMAQEAEEEEDVWEELYKIVFPDIQTPQEEYKPISRSYHHDLEYGIPEPVRNLPDQLPGNVEELYVFLDKYLETTSVIPEDAILIDSENICCTTFNNAKETLNFALCKTQSDVHDLPNTYIVSQQNGRFWYVLSQVVDKSEMFNVALYAQKDEVAKKYLRRQLEDCIYRMDYLKNPEDYQEDCATEEEMIKFYKEQEEQECETYYTNKALCVTCGEVNYAEPVCEAEGHSRMVCCDCIEIVNCCKECNHLSLEYVYDSPNCDGVRVANGDLCFDCKFKKPLREQMPLEVHMSIRSDIQVLTRQQFDILADYAELCEFTIFDAYRYKSRCHYYDCDRMVEPGKWNAEKAVQFCCRRHEDLADHIGCHYQNVYDGSDYDEDWEQAVCKVCNNCNHDTNMIPRIALRESDQGVQPIISVIRMFEELGINNLLFENLVDLCEYF